LLNTIIHNSNEIRHLYDTTWEKLKQKSKNLPKRKLGNSAEDMIKSYFFKFFNNLASYDSEEDCYYLLNKNLYNKKDNRLHSKAGSSQI